MSQVRLLKVQSALAAQINEPGGRIVRDAVQRAVGALEEHRDAAMASIAGAVSELETLSSERAQNTGPQVYAAASRIVDVGGYFDMGPMHSAAHSLCDIAERMITADLWRWDAVEVHVKAMSLILSAGCVSTAQTEVLLDGLRAVVDQISLRA